MVTAPSDGNFDTDPRRRLFRRIQRHVRRLIIPPESTDEFYCASENPSTKHGKMPGGCAFLEVQENLWLNAQGRRSCAADRSVDGEDEKVVFIGF